LYNKGSSLNDLGQYNESNGYYDKILALDPNNVDALNNKGLILNDLGKYNKSIGYYNNALAIDPNHFWALNNKGLALYNLGRYNESIEYYDKALAIEPDNGVALANKQFADNSLYLQGLFGKEKMRVINPMMDIGAYHEELNSFLLRCAELMSVGNNPSPTVLNECFSVINDLNTLYDQLWEKHASTINKYAKAYNSSAPEPG
jgi:tetratricopeptide (TPR) repeat protein